MLRQHEELPRLNYLWVGPPNVVAIRNGELASDVKNVIATARQVLNPVYYYCLDEHIGTFKKLFKAHQVDVSVKSIDATLKECSRHPDEKIRQHSATLLAMKTELLKKPRDRIVDRTSFKDVFGLFLLAREGGYTLDTGIKLAEEAKDIAFASHDHFKAPTIKVDTECWMMYASPDALNEPMLMLEHYLSKWEAVQNIIRADGRNIDNITKYHRNITSLIIESIVAGMANVKKDPAWEFTLEISADGRSVANLKDLPIEKTYSGSHKPEYECREIMIEAVDKVIRKKSSIHREERDKLLVELKNQLTKYAEMKDVLDIHILNNRLQAALTAMVELDRCAVVLGKISSDYQSQSNDEEKKAFAVEIDRVINNTYFLLSEILHHGKGSMPKKINNCILAFKEHVQGVAQQANLYHERKHLHERKPRRSRFDEPAESVLAVGRKFKH